MRAIHAVNWFAICICVFIIALLIQSVVTTNAKADVAKQCLISGAEMAKAGVPADKLPMCKITGGLEEPKTTTEQIRIQNAN